MALEERNGNYYYYKKERDGNRVVSKYYGKGELANLIVNIFCGKSQAKRLSLSKLKKRLSSLRFAFPKFFGLPSVQKVIYSRKNFRFSQVVRFYSSRMQTLIRIGKIKLLERKETALTCEFQTLSKRTARKLRNNQALTLPII